MLTKETLTVALVAHPVWHACALVFVFKVISLKALTVGVFDLAAVVFVFHKLLGTGPPRVNTNNVDISTRIQTPTLIGNTAGKVPMVKACECCLVT